MMSCLDLMVSRLDSRVRGSGACLSICPGQTESRCLSGPRQPTTAGRRQRAAGSRPALRSNSVQSAAPSSCASGRSLVTAETWSAIQHISTTTATSLLHEAKNVSARLLLLSSSSWLTRGPWRMWPCSARERARSDTLHFPHHQCFIGKRRLSSRHESSFACECHYCASTCSYTALLCDTHHAA